MPAPAGASAAWCSRLTTRQRLQGISAADRIVPRRPARPGGWHAFCRDADGGILFHIAGLIHPRAAYRELYEVNVDGTRHLLRAAAEAGVRRVVVVSSNSPFGFNPAPDHRFDEHSPYHPYMDYGRSKMQMEQLVAEVAEPGGLETVIVRPPWFYGPHQPARQTLFFRMIRDGACPILGDGTQNSARWPTSTTSARACSWRSPAAGRRPDLLDRRRSALHA